MMKGLVFAERYRLEDFIGQGGMSLVYRAVDTRTGHSVAVKILKSEYNSDKEFLERFQREAQAASLMSHHNIVNLLDMGVEGEYRYLVLEYVSGATLKETIRQKGRLSTASAVQIGVRILSALQHAHDNGIIHRDIKPQNVLINAEHHVKVADFGIARMANTYTLSKGDMVVGSVHYSSPEQVSGMEVDATSDIYSTGVVMYEMLTGKVPFVGDSTVSVAMQHIKDQPPPITDYAPETPPAVVAVVMKAMAKDPKDRFQSAREMADALLQARDGKVGPEAFLVSQAAYPVKELNPPPAPPVKPSPSPASGRPAGGQATAQHPHNHPRRQLIATTLITITVLGVLTFGVLHLYNQVVNSVTAPDVIGCTVEEGMTLAKRADLVWKQSEENHNTIPAGVVISQLPEPDTEMSRGDYLLVSVSLGPEQETMRDYVGMSYEDAMETLKKQGFDVVIIRTVSTDAEGRILLQNPKGGARYAVGQRVELTVSGGSTLVPDVLGLKPEEAAARLEENNLTAGETAYVEVLDESQIGYVMAQSVPSGTMAVRNAPVGLTIAVASKGYQGSVSMSLDKADHDRTLRVVLIENGVETEQYAATYPAGQSGSLIVPVSSSSSGAITCRVYLDEALYLEQAVNLE